MKGEALALAGTVSTFIVAAAGFFFAGHRYTALAFGLAVLALIAFGVFIRQRIKITGSIHAVHIMRFLDLKQQNPEYDGRIFGIQSANVRGSGVG